MNTYRTNLSNIEDITDFIFIEDNLCIVDALIVLGGPHIELLEKTKKIYDTRLTNTIILSGKYSTKTGRVLIERLPKEYQIICADCMSESEMMKKILTNMSVPSSVLLCEEQSQNTYENIQNSLRILKTIENENQKEFDNIGIVCQAFHARRVFITATRICADKTFHIFPANTQNIMKENWFKHEYGIKRVLGELDRCEKYFG